MLPARLSFRTNESVRELLKEQNILSVNQIFNVEIAKLMQRLHLGEAPNAISNIFTDQRRLLNVQTRSHTTFLSFTTFSMNFLFLSILCIILFHYTFL